MIPEQELLQRARQFEPEALGAVYDRYSSPLYRYAFRLLGNADVAEECVAEVFSRLLIALRNASGPRDHLQAYLYRVAHNWITDRWRRAPPLTVPLPSTLPDEQTDPEHIVGDPIAREQVRQVLACLTADQRQVIVLKFLEDWDNEEIARAMDKPVGAVKSLQHRALAALRRAFDQKGNANGIR